MQAASPTDRSKLASRTVRKLPPQNLACLSAYVGTDLVGFITESAGAFIAYDPHDQLIGTFPTLRAAVRAIPALRS